jgi:hypothetical protein
MWISLALGGLAFFMALPASQEGAPAKDAWPPVTLGMASALGMILLRDQARDAALAAFGFHPAALPHRTDLLSLGIFLVTLAGLVALLALLVRWVRRPVSAAEQEAP